MLNKDKKNQIILIGLFFSLFLAALDQTIVATAMPSIIKDLGNKEYYSWIVSSYLFSSVVFLPVFGRLCDILSIKVLILIANSIFILGSYFCAMANGILSLSFFRFLQGIGGGGIFAITFTTIGILYPPRERGKIQGWIGSVFGLSSILGPLLGGFISNYYKWHWIFLINVPIGILVLFLLILYMPYVEPLSKQKFDYIGSILLFIWSFSFLLLFSDLYLFEYDKILLILIIILGMYFFYKQEKYCPHPLFDMTLLRNGTFLKSSLAMFVFGGPFIGILIFLPLYLTENYKINLMFSSYIIMPLTIGVVISSTIGGRLASKIGKYKIILLFSNLFVFMIFFLLFFSTKYLHITLIEIILIMVFLGFSFGPILPLYVIAVQNSVQITRIGTATSSVQFFRQLGATLGVALLGYIYSLFVKKFPEKSIIIGFPYLMLTCGIFSFSGLLITLTLPDLILNSKHNI